MVGYLCKCMAGGGMVTWITDNIEINLTLFNLVFITWSYMNILFDTNTFTCLLTSTLISQYCILKQTFNLMCVIKDTWTSRIDNGSRCETCKCWIRYFVVRLFPFLKIQNVIWPWMYFLFKFCKIVDPDTRLVMPFTIISIWSK